MRTDHYEWVREWRASGVTWREIGQRLNVKTATLIKRFKVHGKPPKKTGRRPLDVDWEFVQSLRADGLTWKQIGEETGFKPNSLLVAFKQLTNQKA